MFYYCATAVHKSRPKWPDWLKLYVWSSIMEKVYRTLGGWGKGHSRSSHEGALEPVGGNSPDLQYLSYTGVIEFGCPPQSHCLIRMIPSRDGQPGWWGYQYHIVSDATALHSSSTHSDSPAHETNHHYSSGTNQILEGLWAHDNGCPQQSCLTIINKRKVALLSIKNEKK